MNKVVSDAESIFEQIRDGLLNLDPVRFCEKYLTLDGKPFRLHNNGFKPFADMYRYIGLKAIESEAKPVVLVKGRQIGASLMCCNLEMFFMASGLFGNNGRPPMRIMHCFPQLELAYSYSKTKLNTMIATSVTSDSQKRIGKIQTFLEAKLDRTIEANNSLQFKQFQGGNTVSVESTGLTADRIRGRTIDCMFLDEIQDMKGAAIGNATKVLAQAQYGAPGKGIQVYFGTPKQSGTEYYKIWKQSTQQYYYLGCEKCKKHFPLYTPGSSDWEKIWIHGFIVRCTHCQHEQDKREAAERGKWIAANNDPDAKFIGYHINQLYMPHFTREHIESEKPINSPVNTERAYQNEVLGEFFAGSTSPITPEEIEKVCADPGRKFSPMISSNDNRKVYLGCDWGDKADVDQLGVGESGKRQQGQSYSCLVVLVADGPHILSIDYATRLKRNDPESKKEAVEEIFRRYSVTLAVGDIGHATDLTYILQKEYGDRFLASRAVDQVKNHIKYSTDIYPKEITFDRNYHIEELYNTMKQGKIRFPFGDYEKIAWLINHCCSMEMKVSADRNGELKQRYVKGSTQNDGLMSLLNAFLAFKWDITEGFTIKNPNQMQLDPTERKQIPAMTSYLPKFNSWRR